MDNVNIFFSCDDGYVPFLAVTLGSLKKNRDASRNYEIRILHTGMRQDYQTRLTERFHEAGFALTFLNISEQVKEFDRKLFTRDYYSRSTYYRLFIPEMFPELKKALYLDADLVISGDISKLYDTELGDNLVGAIPDGIMNTVEELRLYVEHRLNVAGPRYFNAGVLLMNLEAMRQARFQETFLQLLGAVKFQVAQDQDYLNVICRDRVTYLGYEWNTMPTGIHAESPKLIHYNLDSKPWHRDDVRYGELFWHYAAGSGFEPEIRKIRAEYSQADIDRSAQETVNAIAFGHRQAMDEAENRRIRQTIARVVGA